MERNMDSNLLRKLPKVDDLLKAQPVADFSGELPHEVITDSIRKVIDGKREKILAGDEALDESFVAYDNVVDEVVTVLNFCKINSLRRVINGTGVVLHTNLGRANLSKAAAAAVAAVADRYSTLEYDPETGKRGSRHTHVEEVIKKVTGAEAAMVVNNNAAATMICLATMGAGKEVIVSRGELVEIGGSFRVPEIMSQSGAILAEIGTTNKTKISDYEKRITENTGALLKVHTSNYKIIGFTEEATIAQLRELGDKYGLPVIYDMGSGLMVDLTAYGIEEPTVKDAFSQGADVVLFSGDKLLGGAQGGVLAGKKEFIDKMKKHPLARILRVDKMTLAAMEATFKAYYNEEQAKKEIPVLAMLTRSQEDLMKAAQTLKRTIARRNAGYEITIAKDKGMVGGGSAPSSFIDNIILKITHEKFTSQQLAALLRKGELPIVGRIHEEQLVLDVRTIFADEYQLIADKLAAIAAAK
ncbi:MAG: L-seryl-tRNA(Sec) selenium transferase [Firmicutes bacterium]|nr:L-seryl-tRNA(Sec) selenium transferase [Bacillota bacterium]